MRLVAFSGQHREAGEVMRWYRDVKEALGHYQRKIIDAIDAQGAVPIEFSGMTVEEVRAHIDDARGELDQAASLLLLAAAEAALRMDFLGRVHERRRDPVSRAFRELYKSKGHRVALEEELLEVWRDHEPPCRSSVGEFRGALKLRHWLAHGRYWTPKLGRAYDAQDVFDICSKMFERLPGLGGWSGASLPFGPDGE